MESGANHKSTSSFMVPASTVTSRENIEEARTNEDENTKSSTKDKIIRGILLSVLVCIIIYIILDYSLPNLGYVDDIITSFLLWVENNPAEGVVAFAGVYIVTTVLFIPGSLLTLGAGLVFGRALGLGLGVLLASTAVFFGASIGAILSFLLGRYILQESAQKLFDKFSILSAIDEAIETEGLRLVLLLRLSPVIPFSAFNYVMGLTRVLFKDYVIGCFGILPGTVAYVFIGTSAANLLGEAEGNTEEASDSGNSGLITTIVLVVGSVATIIAVVLVTIASRRALKRVLDAQEMRSASTELSRESRDAETKAEEEC